MKRFIKASLLMISLFATSAGNAQNLTELKNQKLIVQFLNGFDNPEKISESLALLADDYKFENPMVKLDSKNAFIGLAQEMAKALTGVEVINIAGSGEWVSAQYIFKSEIPGLERNMATEWFRIENGIIQESTLIYDASKWREVYAQMNN